MDDDLLELLEYLPDREEEALAQPRFQTPEFCARLLKRIDEIRLAHPRDAEIPARFAIRLTARFSNTLFGQAWAVWGSVERSLSNFDNAGFGHQIANLYLDESVDLARFYRRQAYLLRDRGRFAESKKKLGDAIKIYFASRDTSSRACALVDLGTVYYVEGNYNEAVLRTSEALRYLDPERDPSYHACAVHNLAAALSQCEQPGARLEVLLKQIRQQRYAPGSLAWAKHRWLEGLVFKRRGRSRLAESTLRAARNLLIKLGAAHDAALATMELADLYLVTGDLEKSARMARQMLPIFKSMELEREVIAAFRLYMRAAAAQTLTRAQVQQIQRLLRKLSPAGKIRP